MEKCSGIDSRALILVAEHTMSTSPWLSGLPKVLFLKSLVLRCFYFFFVNNHLKNIVAADWNDK